MPCQHHSKNSAGILLFLIRIEIVLELFSIGCKKLREKVNTGSSVPRNQRCVSPSLTERQFCLVAFNESASKINDIPFSDCTKCHTGTSRAITLINSNVTIALFSTYYCSPKL